MPLLLTFYIGLAALNALGVVGTIGRKRTPTTPGVAVIVVLLQAAYVYGLIVLAR